MNKMNDLTDEGYMAGYMTGIASADLLAALARSSADVGAAARRLSRWATISPTSLKGPRVSGRPPRFWGTSAMARGSGADVCGDVAREEEPEMESFDEGMALRIAGYRWKRLEPLLAEFRIVSNDTLAFLRGLTPGDWTRVGRHPTLGRVSLGDLARIEMEHERDHARQLRAAIARERLE